MDLGMNSGAGGLAEAATIGANSLTDQVKATLCASFANGAPSDAPYRHWIVSDVFPAGDAADAVQSAVPDRGPAWRFRQA